jgi:alpha-galactosidase
MAVQAAVAGDVTLLKQAMLHDPLVGAVCDPEEVWQMTDEMLVAQARWLPQYRRAIPAARKRLAEAKRRGEYRGTWKWKGAARLRVRSVAELRKQGRRARERVTASDKAADNRPKGQENNPSATGRPIGAIRPTGEPGP